MTEVKKFEWYRTHKILDWLEREMIECVESHVLDFYEVDSVEELSEEQMDEIMRWREEELDEYHPLQMGFSSLYSWWEMRDE